MCPFRALLLLIIAGVALYTGYVWNPTSLLYSSDSASTGSKEACRRCWSSRARAGCGRQTLTRRRRCCHGRRPPAAQVETAEHRRRALVRKVGYYAVVALILFFHLELFSGGAMCRAARGWLQGACTGCSAAMPAAPLSPPLVQQG